MSTHAVDYFAERNSKFWEPESFIIGSFISGPVGDIIILDGKNDTIFCSAGRCLPYLFSI